MSGRARRRPGEPGGLAGLRAEKTVSLALQGGGAHGAFTWGVLDALLEDGRLAVEAISGASAGAMNAVVMVEGWLAGGIDGARGQHFETFWRRASVRDAEVCKPAGAAARPTFSASERLGRPSPTSAPTR